MIDAPERDLACGDLTGHEVNIRRIVVYALFVALFPGIVFMLVGGLAGCFLLRRRTSHA